MKNNKCVF
jgi:hypothetical protein